VGCGEAPGKQLGVQCLAQGHFDLQLMGRAGIEPTTLWLQDGPLTPLSYSRPIYGIVRGILLFPLTVKVGYSASQNDCIKETT